MLRFGLVYVEEQSKDGQMQLQKHVMRYPQYFATRAIEETIAKVSRRALSGIHKVQVRLPWLSSIFAI